MELDLVIEELELRYNDAPLSASTTDNWVARRGGLPPMVRAITRALMRNGHSESGAIQIALGAVKRWAAGGGHVHPSTRARSAAAVAHWEAIKGHRSDELTRQNEPAPGSAYAAGHPFFGNQWVPGGAGGIAVGGPGSSTTAIRPPTTTGGKGGTGSKGGSKGGTGGSKGSGGGSGGSSAASKAQALLAAYQAAATALQNAQISAQKAALSNNAAQQKLALAQHSALSDTYFAQLKLPPATATTSAAQVAANQQAVAAAQQAGDQAAQGAKLSADTAALSQASANANLAQAQVKYAAAKKAAGIRSEGHEILVRDWKLWDEEHKLGRLHRRAMKRSGKLVEGGPVKNTDFYDAMAAHEETAQSLRKLADAHIAAGEHGRAVDALHAAKLHEKLAITIRSATENAKFDPSEETDIKKQRQAVQKAFDAVQAPKPPRIIKGYGPGWQLPNVATRQMMGEGNPPGTDSSGAGLLLPVGPSKKQSTDIVNKLEQGQHRFEGADLGHCAICGKPITDSVHQAPAEPGQPIPPVPRMLRHAGPSGHLHVKTGHIAGKPDRHAKAAGQKAANHMDAVEGPLTTSLQSLFSEQRKATISRLEGKRGKQMLKRAAGDPNQPPEVGPENVDAPAGAGEQPSVAPGAVFDSNYWTAKTAETLSPHLQTAGNLAADSVKEQIGMQPMVDDSTSLGALNAIIAARAQAAANYISGTTAKQLSDALQTGVANGEGIPAIAKRVNEVFDNADIVRAKRIAQTEVVGAYNEGALAYASALPPDVIGSRRWLAHHDDRTRPTHKLADGQEQAMGTPFMVGGFPMMAPGDKAAPPSEWINCRCSVAYMPPSMGYDKIAAEAQKYVDGLHAKPPPPSSPYVTTGV